MSTTPDLTPPTPADLIGYVGGHAETDTGYATAKLAQAQALVDRYVLEGARDAEDGSRPTDPALVVPPAVLYAAYLEVGSAVWARRDTTGGAATYDTIDAPPVRTLADPLRGVYADLDPWLRGGFG